MRGSRPGWKPSSIGRRPPIRIPDARRLSIVSTARSIRTSYRDLLAIDMDFNNLLPIDDSGGGDAPFDNIASSLRLTQSLMEVYLSVANRVTRLAVGGAPPEAELQFRVHDDLDQRVYFEGMPFGTRGGISVDHIFAVDGEYEIQVGVRGGGTGHIDLALDGERIALIEVVPRRRGGGEYDGPTASSRVVPDSDRGWPAADHGGVRKRGPLFDGGGRPQTLLWRKSGLCPGRRNRYPVAWDRRYLD